MENCIPLNNNVIIERHKHTKDEVDIGKGKKLFIDTRRFLSFNDDEIKFLSLGIGPKNFNL